ncbi:MAG: hypothetical protein COB15_15985 [Flavobacteriales bacterium]|nr:MAG: hypothetical protein COB15_15985 [Flavobacteriales bacterium]
MTTKKYEFALTVSQIKFVKQSTFIYLAIVKKIGPIILLFLFLNSFSMKSQTYYPFPTNNSFWRFNWGIPGCISQFITDYQYQITGDTIIGLNNYHKLKTSGTFNCRTPGVPTKPSGYVGAYRNDILAKKVYIIEPDSINEQILYDFNLVAGDTIKGYMVKQAINKIGPTYFAVIDSIDSLLINGNYRKRWNYSTNTSLSYSGNIIEGIGNTYDLLGGLRSGFDDNGNLICHSKNGIIIYGTGSCTLVSTKEDINKIGTVEIYPNPTHSVLNIKISSSSNFKLFDLTGKTLIKKQLSSNTNRLDVSKYPKGIYFYQLISEQGLNSGKLIIR